MGILRPDRRLLLVWILYICGCAAVFCGLVHVVSRFPAFSPFLPFLLFGGGITGAVLLLVYCPFRWKRLRYTINSDCLLIQSGVLFKNQKQIPFSGIRYVTVFAGPLERVFRIRTVAVHVTGGMMMLEGIQKNTALQLQTHLLSRSFEEKPYV
jgi:membrane protein YdbS with pleckstrin-like domain